MSDPPRLRCFYVHTTIVHAVVADSPRAAEAIAREDIEVCSPFRADVVRVELALAPPPDRAALAAVPSWESAEAPAGARRRFAWTLGQWLRAQRRGR